MRSDLVGYPPPAWAPSLIIFKHLINIRSISLQSVTNGNIDTYLAAPVESVSNGWGEINTAARYKVVTQSYIGKRSEPSELKIGATLCIKSQNITVNL